MTNRIFIDTNIFIRFLVPENVQQHNSSKGVISLIKEGKITPYISTIVIHELLFTLFKIYKQPKPKILKAVSEILSLRNITIIEKTYLQKALGLFKSLNVKFGDCLIATQLPPNLLLCTFDSDFEKIKDLNIITPEKLLTKLDYHD